MSNEIKKESKYYPVSLLEIKDPPETIYYLGNLEEITFLNCLAIVGSRNITTYGKRVIDRIIGGLNEEIVVVSGFMTGVDSYAHEKALERGLKTIAVMPCGCDVVHPISNKDLYERILKSGGTIISEYTDGFLPRVWTYPRRNRIVAGICACVLVIEAAEKSGSLITAEIARLYNKKVFVVPGSIFGSNYKGIEYLINNYAEAVSSAKKINNLFELDGTYESAQRNIDPVCKVLSEEALTLDEISEKINKPVSEILTKLTLLQMRDLVSEDGGKYYAC